MWKRKLRKHHSGGIERRQDTQDGHDAQEARKTSVSLLQTIWQPISSYGLWPGVSIVGFICNFLLWAGTEL